MFIFLVILFLNNSSVGKLPMYTKQDYTKLIHPVGLLVHPEWYPKKIN